MTNGMSRSARASFFQTVRVRSVGQPSGPSVGSCQSETST